MADSRRFPWPWTVPAIAVTVLTAIVGIVRYPGLPSRIPAHFDVHGTVDRTTRTTVLSAFLPVVIQLALTAALIGAAGATVRAPRGRALDRRLVATAILLLSAFLNLALFVLATQIWRAGRAINEGAGSLLVGSLFAGVVIVVAITIRTAAAAQNAPPPADLDHRRRIFAADRNSKALFVPKRFGIGWTLNFRHPASWVILGLIAAVVLAGAIAGSVSG